MKTALLGLTLLLLSLTAMSQTKTYTVASTSYELKEEVTGTLTLVWNVIDRDYRYFAKKDDILIELVNTKTDAGYQQEYKSQLQQLTTGSELKTDNVNLTLGSLRTFFNTYNKKVDEAYVANSVLTDISMRLGGFGGVTNEIYTSNPNNALNGQFGIEFEIIDPNALPRHSLVVQYKQVLSSDDYDYSAAQFSLNHRFKFIKTTAVAVFLNTKLVTFTSFKGPSSLLTIPDTVDVMVNRPQGTNFQAPIIFGLGTDVRLGKGFVTFQYHDVIAVFQNTNDQFPVDLSIGYKFIL